ncbi:MAG: hypothetical protein ABIR66_07215, partial [Saprospiraceae bacterium]
MMENSGKKQTTSRRGFINKASISGLGMGLLSGNVFGQSGSTKDTQQTSLTAKSLIKITDLRCAIIGGSPVIRITTNEGISGYGQAESTKSYLKPFVLFYKDYLMGEDPTNVERCMMKIRRMGSFKPYGSAVS